MFSRTVLMNLGQQCLDNVQFKRLPTQTFDRIKALGLLRNSRTSRGGRSVRQRLLISMNNIDSIDSCVTTNRRHYSNPGCPSGMPISAGVNHSNSTAIKNVYCTKSYTFPKLLLSNTRSMVNKLDEVSCFVKNNDCDIAVITESWLSSKVSDNLISIPGYISIRRDRPDTQRGGCICSYFKSAVDFLHLHEHKDPDFETQWFLIKLKRHPRGNNSIILTTIYHPPGHHDYLLRTHRFQKLDLILSTYPNSAHAITLMGYFNQFNPRNMISSFKLKNWLLYLLVAQTSWTKYILHYLLTTMML
jgi:hypothetical protein